MLKATSHSWTSLSLEWTNMSHVSANMSHVSHAPVSQRCHLVDHQSSPPLQLRPHLLPRATQQRMARQNFVIQVLSTSCPCFTTIPTTSMLDSFTTKPTSIDSSVFWNKTSMSMVADRSRLRQEEELSHPVARQSELWQLCGLKAAIKIIPSSPFPAATPPAKPTCKVPGVTHSLHIQAIQPIQGIWSWHFIWV